MTSLEFFKLKEDPNPNEDSKYLDKTGCSWGSLEDYVLTEVLGFCGCGSPDQIGKEYILPFLERIASEDFGTYEDLNYMFLCYWGDDKELLDHGTTARCPWLTEKGEKVMEVLNQITY